MRHSAWRIAEYCAAALLVGPACAVGPALADPGADLFTNGTVRRLQITIAPEDVAALRISPRTFVEARLRDGTNDLMKVAIHLKGSTGSFRSIDGKPAWTISFDRFEPGQRFCGLRKIHLNNSVEDPTCLNELLGGDMFRAAGVPASRVAHAIVEFNGKPLGLYVLKEGFTRDFLSLFFRHTTGNLYDTGAGHDVDEKLQKDLGANPEDRSDLEALAQAAHEPDLARRWTRLQRVLDMDRVLSFMAVEILLGHRDGYCLARNNFRVYHDVDAGRLLFFPHGMDILFGNPRAVIEPRMNGLVARSIMETPEGRRAYRDRCADLFTNLFDVPRMHGRIDEVALRLRLALAPAEALKFEQEIVALKRRIAARAEDLRRQFKQTPLELLAFNDGQATSFAWQPIDVPDGGTLESGRTADNRRALLIRAGPVTSASWRAKVLLPPGRYRFEGVIRTSGVKPLKFGKNHGAALRVFGAGTPRSRSLLGDCAWSPLNVSFQTEAREAEVDLVCELRASAGEAAFDLKSLRLVHQP